MACPMDRQLQVRSCLGLSGADLCLSHWGRAPGAQKVLYTPRPSQRQPFKVKLQETRWACHKPRGETRVPIVPYPTPNTYNYKGGARGLLPSEKGTGAASGSPTQSLLPSDIHS